MCLHLIVRSGNLVSTLGQFIEILFYFHRFFPFPIFTVSSHFDIFENVVRNEEVSLLAVSDEEGNGMATYDTISYENRKYLGRWVSVMGHLYLMVDESLADKIKGKRLSKRALKSLPDLNVLLYSPVEMLFENQDVMENYAEMQVIESEFHKKYA